MKKVFFACMAAGIFLTSTSALVTTTASATTNSVQTNPCRNGKVTVQRFTSSGVALNSYLYFDTLAEANAAVAAYNPPGGFTYLAVVCDSTGIGVEP